MIEFSSSLKLNEIHMVDSPVNEDSKNIFLYINIFFSRETPILEKGWLENLRNWAIIGTSVVMQIAGGQFRKTISAPTPWYQNPCDTSIFPHAGTNFKKLW